MDKREPDFINEEGTKWWKHEILFDHAQRSLGEKAACYLMEATNGYKAFVLIDDGKVLEEDHTLEGMAFKIDKHALIRRGW